MKIEEYRQQVGKPKAKRRQPEHEVQKSLFKWAKEMTVVYPELRLLFAIPNGGHRDIRTARKMVTNGLTCYASKQLKTRLFSLSSRLQNLPVERTVRYGL